MPPAPLLVIPLTVLSSGVVTTGPAMVAVSPALVSAAPAVVRDLRATASDQTASTESNELMDLDPVGTYGQ